MQTGARAAGDERPSRAGMIAANIASFDVEEHHRYGAEIACDHLRSLKDKISEAQGLIRSK